MGAIRRLKDAALPAAADAGAFSAKLRLDASVDYQIAEGLSRYARVGETIISMADPKL